MGFIGDVFEFLVNLVFVWPHNLLADAFDFLFGWAF